MPPFFNGCTTRLPASESAVDIGDDETARAVAEIAEQIVPFVLEPDAVDQAPLVGALTLGRPGADLVPVPGSDRCVVLVERQFPTLAHLVAKALAAALPTREDGDRLQLQLDDETWEATLGAGTSGGAAVCRGDGRDPAAGAAQRARVCRRPGTRAAGQHDAAGDRVVRGGAALRTLSRRDITRPRRAGRGWNRSGSFERFDWTAEQDHEAVARASMAVLNRARQTFGDVRLVAWALDAWLTTQMLIAGGAAVVQGLGQETFDSLIETHAERRGLYRAHPRAGRRAAPVARAGRAARAHPGAVLGAERAGADGSGAVGE